MGIQYETALVYGWKLETDFIKDRFLEVVNSEESNGDFEVAKNWNIVACSRDYDADYDEMDYFLIFYPFTQGIDEDNAQEEYSPHAHTSLSRLLTLLDERTMGDLDELSEIASSFGARHQYPEIYAVSAII